MLCHARGAAAQGTETRKFFEAFALDVARASYVLLFFCMLTLQRLRLLQYVSHAARDGLEPRDCARRGVEVHFSLM